MSCPSSQTTIVPAGGDPAMMGGEADGVGTSSGGTVLTGGPLGDSGGGTDAGARSGEPRADLIRDQEILDKQ